MSRSDILIAGGAMVATAGVGVLGTDVDSRWYRGLRKPPFQPPGPVFGIVWTALYTLLGISIARTLGRVEAPERRRFGVALGVNLVLNVGWTWVFFRGHRPGLATVEILALQASTIELARRTARIDAVAAVLLAPYAMWVGFAAVLTGDIVRRNRGARSSFQR